MDDLKARGLTIQETQLSTDTIAEEVAGGGMWFIVLVDLRYMPYAPLSTSLQPSYVGHFIVVVRRCKRDWQRTGNAGKAHGTCSQFDYDFKTDSFQVMDPSMSAGGVHKVSLADLDHARDKRGTDHDVLQVPVG